MSDTPETDGLARGNHVVPTEWAEQLEKERNEARHEQSSIQCAFEDSQDKIEELERERDEWAKLCGQYKQERDEARAQP
jgi:hypothetical protein